MNKYIVSLLFAGFCSAALANSTNYPSTRGFIGPNTGQQTVESVKNGGFFSFFTDDRPVVLTGHIIGAVGGELYTFRDETGEITLDIDHEVWYGIPPITPQTRITVYGEVDNDFLSTHIEVDGIRPAA